MEGHFDALVTVDKQLPHEQQLRGRSFRVVVLRAQSNRFADLMPLVDSLLVALSKLDAGEATEVAG